jgi:hypothetical protein
MNATSGALDTSRAGQFTLHIRVKPIARGRRLVRQPAYRIVLIPMASITIG